MGLSLLLLLTAVACSDKEDDRPKGTHVVNVVPVPIGITRLDDIKLFVSERPFESFETFNPLTSVDVPKNRKLTDSVRVDVSEYVGKTLYFVALRKHLLSDGYYNITGKENGQSLENLKCTIEPEKPKYDLSFIIRDPKSTDYTYDYAALALMVKKANTAVPSKTVYWYGTSQSWGQPMIDVIEMRYRANQSVVHESMGNTNANGIVNIKVPVNETGILPTNGDGVDLNEHVFFVLENGKVKPVLVKVNALELSKTLQY